MIVVGLLAPAALLVLPLALLPALLPPMCVLEPLIPVAPPAPLAVDAPPAWPPPPMGGESSEPQPGAKHSSDAVAMKKGERIGAAYTRPRQGAAKARLAYKILARRISNNSTVTIAATTAQKKA